jgi:asparagine synthase (glutamine-hydrolysing)
MAEIIIEKKYQWLEFADHGVKCWSIGSRQGIRTFLREFGRNQSCSILDLCRMVDQIDGNFALMIQTGNRVVAFVDRIRSYPIYFTIRKDRLLLANSARALQRKAGLRGEEDLSIVEFFMAGYVTGTETVVKDLFQLQAGELLLWDEGMVQPICRRYYRFFSESAREDDEDSLTDELERVTNEAFSRVVTRANGAPIWVPLSGGLDSRLVLCKLKQFGYERLQAFSYGPPGNYEAKAAAYVAKKVGVEWRFFPSLRNAAVEFFNSTTRKNHWAFSDGLCVLPFYQDIQILDDCLQKGTIPTDAIIINGNSGDFITGGHIPLKLAENVEELPLSHFLDSIINRHFSLWQSLKTKERVDQVKTKIVRVLGIAGEKSLSSQEFAKYWEWWEWQERQSKFVVNGQRNYDFFGLRWELPHWDEGFLRFWEKIPLQWKIGQRLYKTYLEKHDLFGVFRHFPFEIWRWPGAMIAMVPAARLMKLLFGKWISDHTYKMMSFWGHYRDWYACAGFRRFLSHCFDARGPNAFFAALWLEQERLGMDLLETLKWVPRSLA